jgi:DNA-directed RNA polymerase specialized sigma24 family protein
VRRSPIDPESQAKITAHAAEALSSRQIARIFGVAHGTVRMIVRASKQAGSVVRW